MAGFTVLDWWKQEVPCHLLWQGLEYLVVEKQMGAEHARSVSAYLGVRSPAAGECLRLCTETVTASDLAVARLT